MPAPGLLVFEYAGYGCSARGHRPLFSALLSDAEACFAAAPEIMRAASGGGGTVPPMVLFGRSLGSLSAVHLAWKASATASAGAAAGSVPRMAGLVVESGCSRNHRLGELCPRGRGQGYRPELVDVAFPGHSNTLNEFFLMRLKL